MQIAELYGLEGAAHACGHVVVIDVLRAFTCSAYALAGGAAEVLLAGTVDEALALKRARPGSLLVGHGRRDEAHLFDIANSPHALTQTDLRGKTLIQRTGSGTPGVAAAAGKADAVCVASLVNASATARHLRTTGAAEVTLVAMGAPPGGVDGPEDFACRDLIAARLRRVEPDLREIRETVRLCPAAAELRDPARAAAGAEDLRLALDVDRFGFAIEVRRDGGRLVLRRVDVRVRPSVATALPFPLARAAALRRLDRIVTRADVSAVVDALVAADLLTPEMCVLTGRTGSTGPEDLVLLDRTLSSLGIAVDAESAALVETLSVVRDLVEWRITPLAARAAIPRPHDFGSPPAGLDMGLWDQVARAEDALPAGAGGRRIVDVAREILRTYAPAMRVGSGSALRRTRTARAARAIRPTSASPAGSGTPSRSSVATASR